MTIYKAHLSNVKFLEQGLKQRQAPVDMVGVKQVPKPETWTQPKLS